MHKAFQIPYMYGCKTKLYRQHAQVIENRENAHIQIIGLLAAVNRMTVELI
jgi:hypothetical protein